MSVTDIFPLTVNHIRAIFLLGGDILKAYERVAYLRKEILHMTQQDFSDSIDISRSNLGSIETGKVKLVDRTMKAICKAHHVNILWLKDGIGDILLETPDVVFDDIAIEFNLSEDDVELVREICELDTEIRNELKKYIRAIIKARKEE